MFAQAAHACIHSSDFIRIRSVHPLQINYSGMFHFFFLISRQGKCRLAKWCFCKFYQFKLEEVTFLRRYDVVDQKIKKKTQREVTQLVLSRPSKMCNFIEWKDQKIIFKRCVHVDFLCRDCLTQLSAMLLCILCVGLTEVTMS